MPKRKRKRLGSNMGPWVWVWVLERLLIGPCIPLFSRSISRSILESGSCVPLFVRYQHQYITKIMGINVLCALCVYIYIYIQLFYRFFLPFLTHVSMWLKIICHNKRKKIISSNYIPIIYIYVKSCKRIYRIYSSINLLLSRN